jgi:hypothetical protein
MCFRSWQVYPAGEPSALPSKASRVCSCPFRSAPKYVKHAPSCFEITTHCATVLSPSPGGRVDRPQTRFSGDAPRQEQTKHVCKMALGSGSPRAFCINRDPDRAGADCAPRFVASRTDPQSEFLVRRKTYFKKRRFPFSVLYTAVGRSLVAFRSDRGHIIQ